MMIFQEHFELILVFLLFRNIHDRLINHRIKTKHIVFYFFSYDNSTSKSEEKQIDGPSIALFTQNG